MINKVTCQIVMILSMILNLFFLMDPKTKIENHEVVKKQLSIVVQTFDFQFCQI